MHEVVEFRYITCGGTSYVDVLGIDISKDDFHACLQQQSGSAKKSFPNCPSGFGQVLRWLKNRRSSEVHACMEATGPYWLALASALHKAGIAVSVVNPSRTAMFARSQLRRTKTDRVDAEMIADFCKTQTPVLWSPPAPQILELRGFLTYRAQLVSERTRLKQIAGQIHADRNLRKLHVKQLKNLDAAIASLETSMRALLRGNPELADKVQKLSAVGGLGFVSAAAIVAKLPIERLRNEKAAAAYIGVTPSERQSGTSVHGKSRICKTGDAELRRDLYMPAMVAMRHNRILRTFAQRLADRGKPGKVIIVAVMRKLIVLAFRLLSGHLAGASA